MMAITCNCSVPGELGLDKKRGENNRRQFFIKNRTLESKEQDKELCRDFLHLHPSYSTSLARFTDFACIDSSIFRERRELETHRAGDKIKSSK